MTREILTLTPITPLYLYYFPTEKLFPNMEDLGWLLVLAWLYSVWAFQLSASALKKLSAFTVNLSFNLEPVYGIILAFVFFGENKNLNQWFYIGFALIAAALAIHVLLILKEERNKKQETKVKKQEITEWI